MNPDFQSKVDDATSGILASLARSLLEVGSVCQTAGLSASHLPDPWSHVYSALMEAWKLGEEYDFLILCNRLRAAGVMSSFRDSSDIIEQLRSFSHPSLAGGHIAALLAAHAARKMHELGSRLVSLAFDPATDSQELLEGVRKDLEKIHAAPVIRQTKLSHFANQVLHDLENPEQHDAAESIRFGLGLDEGAGPFYRGDLVVIAGETKGGKTAVAGNIVENVSIDGFRSALFSFEMTGKQNAERMLASQSFVNLRDLRAGLRINSGQLDSGFSREATEIAKIRAIAKKIESWKVEVFEHLASIDQVTAEMARMKAFGGLDLAVIDYAQLVKGLRSDKDNREREVASIPRELKKAGLKNECVVILLSQLNEQGRLRESRALGQDANCVLFLEGEGEQRTIRVGAARSAPGGTEIPIRWDAKFTKFSRA